MGKQKAVSKDLTEKILRECHEFYTEGDDCLTNVAELLGDKLLGKFLYLSLKCINIALAPRKKITVMLMGNHSAGKSSFINWYIDEKIQRTGVAIETQGFTIVTSGKKRETLSGNATVHLYPEFKVLLLPYSSLISNLADNENRRNGELHPNRNHNFEVETSRARPFYRHAWPRGWRHEVPIRRERSDSLDGEYGRPDPRLLRPNWPSTLQANPRCC